MRFLITLAIAAIAGTKCGIFTECRAMPRMATNVTADDSAPIHQICGDWKSALHEHAVFDTANSSRTRPLESDLLLLMPDHLHALIGIDGQTRFA